MTDDAAWLKEIREDAFSVIGGWFNEKTGLGDPDRDKTAASGWLAGLPLNYELLRELFNRNDLARAICTAHPEWGLRNGWDLSLEGDAVTARETEASVGRMMDKLLAQESQLKAAVWGQTFGGGLMLIGADDGRATETPLDETKLRAIRFLRVVPRQHARILGVFDNPERPRFGESAKYEIREPMILGRSAARQVWDESRVILYPGVLTEDDTKVNNEGWDQSILDVVVLALRKHGLMWDDAGGMMADGSQGVWKIKGLAQAAVSGLADAIQARFKLADQARSMFRSILLDADKEDFNYVHRNFSGIDALLNASAVRTAGAAQIPATVLMGQSPAGQNATGESDLELWYARVVAYQNLVLLSRLRRLVRLLFISKDGPTRGVEPSGWAVSLSDPRSLTPMQRVELRARQSQVDSAMIANKVLTPEEVAVNRYTAEGWSDVTQIDLGWRRSFLDFMATTIGGSARIFPAQLATWLGTAPQGVQPTNALPEGAEAPQNPQTGAPE